MQLALRGFIILLFTSIASTFSSSCYAQDIKLSGWVFEAHTEEPLPFVNVFIKGTTIGTHTSMDGYFELICKEPADTLVASAIGYVQQFKEVTNAADQKYKFELERANFDLQEITILPGINPAFALLESIIENKVVNNKLNLNFYQYEVYNKLEVDIDEISEDWQNRKFFKPFKFIFDNIDSVSEDKPFLPIFFTESLSEYYYRANPKNQKEVIKATKMSGVSNESVTQFLGGMYQDINVYENWIPVFGKQFVSPISSAGKTFYRYYIIDSNTIDSKWCYQVSFVPKSKSDFTFKGDFWVNDTSFAIKRLSMEVAPHVNLNWVEKLSVFQEFTFTQNVWMLEKDKLIVDFETTERTPSLIGRKSTSFREFVINDSSINDKFKLSGDVIINDDALNKDEEFWQLARHDSLSKNEQSIYHIVDTLREIPLFRTYVDIITLLVSGYKVVGNFEIGPYFTTYSSNVIESHRFRLGLRTSNAFSTRWMIGGHLAYGTGDRKFKYGAYTTYFLSKKPRLSIGGKYDYDVNVSSASKDAFGQDNLFSGLYRKNLRQKLILIEEKKIFIAKEWKFGYSNTVSLDNRILDPYFNFGYIRNSGEPDIADTLHVLNATELTMVSRFAYREKFVSGEFERISLGSRYPIVQFKYALGIKDFLEGQFQYHKFSFSIEETFPINPIGRFSFTLGAGKIIGDLPYLLLEVHPGNETYFYNKYAFNNMNRYEFVSDEFATLFISHHFDGFILNRVPLVRKLKWRLLTEARTVVGRMSAENKAANDPVLNDIKIPDKEPYVETGIGIENIFRILRVDGTWRITHKNDPNISTFSVRLSMQLEF